MYSTCADTSALMRSTSRWTIWMKWSALRTKLQIYKKVLGWYEGNNLLKTKSLYGRQWSHYLTWYSGHQYFWIPNTRIWQPTHHHEERYEGCILSRMGKFREDNAEQAAISPRIIACKGWLQCYQYSPNDPRRQFQFWSEQIPLQLSEQYSAKKRHFFQRRGWNMTEYLEKYLALQMEVGKFIGATRNNSGAISFKLMIMSNETGVTPITMVDRADDTTNVI